MPVGTRPLSLEEHRIIDALKEIPLTVDGGRWRFRQRIALQQARGEKITMVTAEQLRRIAWEMRDKFPPEMADEVEAFARSSVGAFPHTKQERPAPAGEEA
jgi:hypothetical protein